MSRRYYETEDELPSIWKILGVGLLVILFVWGICAAAFGLRVATAGIVGRGEAHIQIQSAGSRIPAYNSFFDLCASVQNAEIGIDQQSMQLEKTTDPNEVNRINTNISALQMTRANGIHQYNADSAKDYTVGQFKDSDLPYRLDDSPYIYGKSEHTSCEYGR